ncbi:thioredoxin-like 1-1, chloroplastic [Cucurbita pepo subsp. pepo]|uniref:thioredoxin-like 1-1, chloroplastic n=1 Tax=Cucurbita pepo subsp. pepo TaxID=3664 RepID=UPI000C9D5AE6|nr:thioredoxin-like 1-1, chloroplastic [Cucurbita pepo subsp. pepo]
MADALSKISFSPSRPSFSPHHLPPPIYGLKSVISSSNPSTWKRLSLKLPSASLSFSSRDSYGGRIEFREAKGISRNSTSPTRSSTISHSGFRTPKAQKWWEKGLEANMKEVSSAQELVDSLLNAGDKLVIVDFFSPGCGGCKALHPKICQFAEMNPEIQFLQVNYEEHKSMCYSLGVHVLPFFRFYRGAQGRVCSFSCTNATMKKFKDALAKHNTDRCSLGPTRGLEEKELMALAANRELCFNYTPKAAEEVPIPITIHARAHAGSVKISESEPSRLPLPSTILKSAAQTSKGNAYVG